MPPPRKQLIRIAKIVIAIMVTIGLVWSGHKAVIQWNEQTTQLRTQVAELTRAAESADGMEAAEAILAQRDAVLAGIPTLANVNWSRLAIASLLYGLGIMANGLVLREALMTFGHRVGVVTSVAAQTLGQVGKYVPGKAMVVVMRAGALREVGVPVVPASISVFMETFLMMGVGATVAGVLVLWLPVPTWLVWSAIGLAVAACIPTLPPILRRVAMRVMPNSQSDEVSDGSDGSAFDELSRIAPTNATRFLVIGWLWTLVSWAGIGGAFMLTISAIPSTAEQPAWPLLAAASTAAIALAMVIGFVSLLPGGAGIRELVLTTLLSPVVGPASALLSAIAARIMSIVVEVLLAGLAWWVLRKPDASKSSPLD
ncbi:lysylphosphatidylglycerol synthase transmembrane domain-containing protein [Stieleria varia]|uniref:Lysylphosphatidylglycerol synthase TM region n=1 Tax=Stieleria varia TaxID=2528005 RepID=A0A5C6AX04_9BACT|nr:lysylphosphatidylglycerol synthase domain-containing protein [Stieleria varia]TWU04270.1 hypothetical protein Pla52n_23090 [Stieleria varia]